MISPLVGGYREDGHRISFEHDEADHRRDVVVSIIYHDEMRAYVVIPEAEAVDVLRWTADNIEKRINEREGTE